FPFQAAIDGAHENPGQNSSDCTANRTIDHRRPFEHAEPTRLGWRLSRRFLAASKPLRARLRQGGFRPKSLPAAFATTVVTGATFGGTTEMTTTRASNHHQHKACFRSGSQLGVARDRKAAFREFWPLAIGGYFRGHQS